ncbi:MAG: hypothetical protein OEX81_02485 [Candidatus Pacebacteria bacterium]|nr:hypothetical protein [Candidatus Paceibacterota bacterium]
MIVVINSETSFQLPTSLESPPDHTETPVVKEQEPQAQELVSNYHDIAIEKAEELTSPEMAKVIAEVISEIDRQGIESFTTFENEKGKWPVSIVSVTEIFRKVFQDKIAQKKLTQEEQLANSEIVPQKRSTVIIPGFSPPPVGHPFTPWDYVYNQAFTDLPRIFAAWKKGEPLPEVDVRVLGSANSDWGEVTPEFLADIQEKGFGAHGEMVADYLKKNLLEGNDYVRVNGISMGSLIATEAIDHLSDEELSKMQFLLDNPADQYYKNRLLKMLRAVQLPLGMGLDYAQVLARLPHYADVYKGEPDFLEKFKQYISQKKKDQGKSGDVPSDDEKQMALKKSAFKAECLLLLKQPTADLNKKIAPYVRKGITDITTSTFGDVMFNLLNKLGKRNLFRQLGNRKHFTVNMGHQRENFNVEKWAKVIKRSTDPKEAEQDRKQRIEQNEADEKKLPRWKKLFKRIFVRNKD